MAEPSSPLQSPAIKAPRAAFYGVALVAFAELWERASYYSLVALIALFAVATIKDGGLGLTNSEAIKISGDYTLMAFGLPVIFGFFGDRFIGHYRAVVLGAFVIVSGNLDRFRVGQPEPTVLDGGNCKEGNERNEAVITCPFPQFGKGDQGHAIEGCTRSLDRRRLQWTTRFSHSSLPSQFRTVSRPQRLVGYSTRLL